MGRDPSFLGLPKKKEQNQPAAPALRHRYCGWATNGILTHAETQAPGLCTPPTPPMVSPTSGTPDMARDGLSREDAAERVALAQARIEAAVAAIQSGSEWATYLKLQSSFHRYSANNVWLIACQHAAAFDQGLVDTPWPTCVAGFNTWKALGRSPDGLRYLTPCHAGTLALRRTARPFRTVGPRREFNDVKRLQRPGAAPIRLRIRHAARQGCGCCRWPNSHEQREQ
jgi:hypothetical protein